MTPTFRLSKSRFVAGVQCHKLLWWKVHEPAAGELQVDKVPQDLFDQGVIVGKLATDQFPGGVLIDLPHTAVAERVTATQTALDAGAPAIFEASFFADRVFVAVDVLLKTGTGHTLIEVKSSTEVKDEHIAAAAIQAWVLSRSGVAVDRVEIMHLNKEYRHPGQGPLLVREDVTERIEAWQVRIPEMVAAQLAMLEGPLPEVAVGAPEDVVATEAASHPDGIAAEEAAPVGHQVAEGELAGDVGIGDGELRQILHGVVVERELALILQHAHRQGGERLRVGANGEEGSLVHLVWLGHIPDAEALGVHRRVVADDSDGQAGDAPVLAGLVDVGVEVAEDVLLRGGWRGDERRDHHAE